MATSVPNEISATRTRRPVRSTSDRVDALRSYGSQARASSRAARFQRSVHARPGIRAAALHTGSRRAWRARVDWAAHARRQALDSQWRDMLAAGANTVAWGIAFGVILLMVMLVVF